MIAFDKKTGDVLWDEPRPELIFAHSSPILVMLNGKPQLICSHSNSLEGVDPRNGKKLWSIESSGETASPAFGNNLVYADTGRGGGGVCIDVSGPQPQLKWKSPNNQIGEGLGSPIIIDNVLYRLHRGDFLLARAADTGQTLFSEHLPQVSAWASPFATADGLLYFATAGRSYVLKPGPKLEIVAKNDLNDPNPAASPAVADGRIYLRGTKFLYCIGNQ
jgi:outer membrane protein assembly factor BamB